MRTIEIARDFSRTPGGRFRHLGPYSGEEFREDYLVKALCASREVVEVVLDDTAGYGSSFLEEAFGGLVRSKQVDVDAVRKRLRITARTPLFKSYADEAQGYVEDAIGKLS